ncbi:hypothetical protein WN944_029420 [Citrus x changshan-huyou]|uniref:Dirigent protein n=1 Tax=Citrus x changshan-huyou TaxID=2935761 RepID=A0AAP0LL80_9ROSI
MSMSFVFVDGPNNGNCISLLGNNRLRTFVHEMPIVSGTGVFLLPRSIGWLLNLAMPLLDTML